jgi:hypothetical protein
MLPVVSVWCVLLVAAQGCSRAKLLSSSVAGCFWCGGEKANLGSVQPCPSAGSPYEQCDIVRAGVTTSPALLQQLLPFPIAWSLV